MQPNPLHAVSWHTSLQSPTPSIPVRPAPGSAKIFPVDFDGENGGVLPICVETYNQAIRLVVPNENLKLVMKDAATNEEENVLDSIFYSR